jgi:hypothetical protein
MNIRNKYFSVFFVNPDHTNFVISLLTFITARTIDKIKINIYKLYQLMTYITISMN